MAGVIERNNVHVRGAGDRTIVFAHGFGCDFKQRRDAGRTIVADWQLAERSRMPNPLANKKLRPKRIGPSMLPEKPRRALTLLERLTIREVSMGAQRRRK
jgi:hypothetical protein